ncbi:dockerin type I domain-containing protein [Rubripirellula reticaptiva]|uniref:Dockerin type I repeat protein n=1 Tax=Rubripirellula reticaptiva TaxID=2528013 RepID=A0A5C6FB66_9BACT|nr:dockerin type I domain-containing protein [Rubripirellula reticaptiva]TWU57386.1 Dockerin type I repeat protein [Rubripirellula reticaptiva]
MPRRLPFHRRKRERKLQVQRLESRQLMAADSFGVTPKDTGEFLLGTVTVTPVFLESNGQIDTESQDWTPEEIDAMIAKVGVGVNWWSDTLDTLDTVHTLDFVIDETYARTPFETPYEPIDLNTSAINDYIGDFVTRLGYGDARSIEEAVQRFNHDQRIKNGTDWAFTIFVADSSDDPDGLFASGGSFSAAFAYAGGLFMVTPSTRPASTITHEMGHIFWARDEYFGGGSWTDQRGYYNTQNLNAADNPTPGFSQDISIMRGGVPLTAAYEAHTSPASTLAMVGWQDSDGDGIFDIFDVPLQLDGVGYFDSESSTYHFTGEASVTPLRNQNSSGTQSDISLAKISELQYQLDDGPWVAAASPNAQSASFDVSFVIESQFTSIQFRAVDTATGVTSETITGNAAVAAVSAASISGVAFYDENGDGSKSDSEISLSLTSVTVSRADGSPLFTGSAVAADFAEGEIDDAETIGIKLAADGLVSDTQVASHTLVDTDRIVFESFDLQRSEWTSRWSSKVALTATFDEPVGEVHVSVVGLDDVNYGRVEAYNAAGDLVARQTTSAIGVNESTIVTLRHATGAIASIRIFGHAGSSVAVDSIDFGVHGNIVTDQSGAFRLADLPNGGYIVELLSFSPIHAFTDPIEISVVGGKSDFISAAAVRTDSPRHNTALAEDANQDGEVTARDALVIINDLTRSGPRTLSAGDLEGFDVDVNNDGTVSALDALLVINAISRNRNSGDGEQFVSQTEMTSQTSMTAETVIVGSERESVDTTRSSWLLTVQQSENLAKATSMFNFDGGVAVVERVVRFPTDTTESTSRPLDLMKLSSSSNDQKNSVTTMANTVSDVSTGLDWGSGDTVAELTTELFIGIDANLPEPFRILLV